MLCVASACYYTRGDGQRRSAKSEKGVLRPRISLQSTIVYTRRRQPVHSKSHEKKTAESLPASPSPWFSPSGAASAATKENQDGRGKGDKWCGVNIYSGGGQSRLRPGSWHPSPAVSLAFPRGSLPWECIPVPGGGDCGAPLLEHHLSKGGGFVAQVPGGPGDPWLPTPRLHPHPPLRWQWLTLTMGDTGSLTRVPTHFIVNTTPARVGGRTE